jgi:predicted double-glycine peptidase
MGTWTAWDGRPIHYSLIEHTVTLSGVSESQVRVNDPWHAGSQYWISKAAFETSWHDFNNMAVIF